MLRNYLKIAWRNIVKNRVFSLLNIVGLATGLLCSLLIFLWVSDELAVDRYHENSEKLYTVYERVFYDGKINGAYYTPAHLYRELKLKLPEVEKASPTVFPKEKTFANGPKVFKRTGNYVSTDYFHMFSYSFLEGSAETAMTGPNDIAISREMAELFFGSAQNAMGKGITYENSEKFQVSAVFEEVGPSTMEINDFYLHWDVYLKEHPYAEDWTNNDPNTFIQLVSNADAGSVGPKIKNFLRDYNRDIGENFDIELYLQPYGDKYLYSNFENGRISGGKIENVRVFGYIAFFILLIACINFMNLASAGSLKRAKEIGIRKVLGAKKGGLVYQFLGEAVLLSLISTVVAILLLALVLPAFNQLAEKDLGLLDLSGSVWAGILVIALLTGLISGSYPAFMLSSFNIVGIFRKKTQTDSKSHWIRQGLVVFQFSLSIILICGMIITSRQIDYIQDKNLGFDRQNLLTFPLEGELVDNFETFKGRALQFPGVRSMSAVFEPPLEMGGITFEVVWQGKEKDDMTAFTTFPASADFLRTWGCEIVAGRDFRDRDSKGFEYILNETAIKAMGLEDPIGKPLSQWGMDGTIVGVVKDFHFDTMKKSIGPLVIRHAPNYVWLGTALVKIDPNNVRQIVASLESLHGELNPAFPFQYSFTDQQYDLLYKSENMFFRLSQYFSVLAIFISCLGLFGLVMFTAQQKVKEIGIRKVLGASVMGITSLLAKDFLKLVLLAIAIGSPVVWYLMDRWLANYEYRIDMPWWAFGIAGILAVGIAVFTLSFESIKAANADPVKSLRAE
ncbi:ABC transporter permease [Ulvibacterium marinum]|uniref:ABC transporter permease n=1 Tax=Ulvibacterium marinum TaxID=2419782 RepID=A0A3B0C952_9FLAO|nr:ABC transporter permease [Ulvibacterium marinum]RKN82855.1 ABC transporter permease [Ulvibacterium marinum]